MCGLIFDRAAARFQAESVKLARAGSPSARRGETRVDRVAGETRERVRAQLPLDERVFVAQGRAEQRRIVGVDRTQRTPARVERGDADAARPGATAPVSRFEVGQISSAMRAPAQSSTTSADRLERAHAVADPLGAEDVDRFADALRPRRLAGVRDDVQPAHARIAKALAIELRRDSCASSPPRPMPITPNSLQRSPRARPFRSARSAPKLRVRSQISATSMPCGRAVFIERGANRGNRRRTSRSR